MALRIKFRAQCFVCRQWFEPGKAWLTKRPDGWKCQCDACYSAKKEGAK